MLQQKKPKKNLSSLSLTSLDHRLAVCPHRPRLAVHVHGHLQLAQLGGGPRVVLDEAPLDGAAEVFLSGGGGGGSGCVCVCVGVGGGGGCLPPPLSPSSLLLLSPPFPHPPHIPLTLNPSVNARCASLNSGVEKDRRGSSSRAAASSLATWARSSASREAASGVVVDAPARRSKSACGVGWGKEEVGAAVTDRERSLSFPLALTLFFRTHTAHAPGWLPRTRRRRRQPWRVVACVWEKRGATTTERRSARSRSRPASFDTLAPKKREWVVTLADLSPPIAHAPTLPHNHAALPD